MFRLALIKTFYKKLLIGVLCCLVSEVLTIVQIYLIKDIILYITDEDASMG